MSPHDPPLATGGSLFRLRSLSNLDRPSPALILAAFICQWQSISPAPGMVRRPRFRMRQQEMMQNMEEGQNMLLLPLRWACRISSMIISRIASLPCSRERRY